MVQNYLFAFAASTLLSAVLTRHVRNFAIGRGWVDAPDLNRHHHVTPVPRLGGVAIFLSFLIVVGASLIIARSTNTPGPFPVSTVLGILGPALIVFLMGVYDDLRLLQAHWKFGIQSLAAVLLYLGGFGIYRMDLLSSGHPLPAAVGLPLTILWVLLITNAFNLIDGLDGLAAGSALFSALVVFILSLRLGNHLVSFLAIALAGAILGFLRFNFHPASIFLGDSGSLFTGFMLSALAMVGSQKAPTMVAVAIPVVSFGLPILDVVITVMRRFLSAKPLFQGDQDHIHHKLLKRGLSHREAVLILYAVSAGFGLLSLALLHGQQTIALVLAVIGIGVWSGVQYLRYAEFSELRRLLWLTTRRRHLMANNVNIRRAAESLHSCGDFLTLCRILKDTLQPAGFDGFCFEPSSLDWVPESLPAPLSRDAGGRLRWCWAHPENSEPSWELKLELSNGERVKWGYFSLYRKCGEQPLLLDINLFSSEFRAALSDAAHRVMNGSQPAAKDYEPVESARAAKAASSSFPD